MNLRYEILDAISKMPYIPFSELHATIDAAHGCSYQRLKDSVGSAAKDDLITLKRDDVSSKPGYVLTAAGKARHAEGPAKQSRISRMKDRPAALAALMQAEAPQATEPETPAPEPEPIVFELIEPEPEPEFVAPELDEEVSLINANRRLLDRQAGIAHALRGSGLAGLRDLDDGDDLQVATAALTGAYQQALADLANANQLIGILKRNLATKNEEIEHLAARLDECLYADPKTLQTGGEVVGYMVINSDIPPMKTLDEARETALEVVSSSDRLPVSVYAVIPAGRAAKEPVWEAA